MDKASVPASDEPHFNVVILQPSYLPWLGYFDLVALADVFVIYDDVQFDKGGWRNRNRILCAAKPLWLTVPIIRGFPQTIREVKINQQEIWQARHLQSIQHNYRKAPFYDAVFPHLESYLSSKRYEWLLDLCVDGHSLLASLLEVHTRTVLVSELGVDKIGRTTRLVEICKRFHATRYTSPDASSAYMENDLWAEAGIDLVYQDFRHPQYDQHPGQFISHLSVVDALMFAGVEKVRTWLGESSSKRRPASHANL